MSAGLADVTQHHIDVVDVRREREARALVAVLPFECAVFLLHPTPPERIREEPPPAIAERLVGLLTKGWASRLCKRRVASSRASSPSSPPITPTVTKVTGLEIDDYFGSARRSQADVEAVTWVRDHLGLDLPARSALVDRHRHPAPQRESNTEAFSLRVFLALEILACSEHSFEKTRRHTCTATAMETSMIGC